MNGISIQIGLRIGGSAGAQICMWLAYSDVWPMPPVMILLNESQRDCCVATAGGQTSAERDFYIENILPLLGENVPVEVLVSLSMVRTIQRRFA